MIEISKFCVEKKSLNKNIFENNVTTVRDEAKVSQRKTRLREQHTLFFHDALIGECSSFYVKLLEFLREVL